MRKSHLKINKKLRQCRETPSFVSVIPPAVTPADAADDHTPRFKFPTMSLVSTLGSRPKPQYISVMEHLFPFRGGAGPQHAPSTFFCPATLHDSLFWEAQVGT